MSGTYYVSTNGLDSNDGSIGSPFLTINRFATSGIAGDICFIRGGTFRETVIPSNSGTDESTPIVFSGYPGETAVVHGADIITGWTLDQGSIYKSDGMTWTLGRGYNQMLLDGVMVNEASWPPDTNVFHSYTNMNVVTGGRLTEVTGEILDTTNLLQGDGFWSGATVHANYSPRYHGITGLVTNYVTNALQIYWDQSALYSGYYITNLGIYYMYGTSNCMSVPGQWYICTNDTNVYLRTHGSDDPTGHVVEMKRRSFGFILTNKSFITISNLSLTCCTITNDSNSYHIILDNLTARYPSHTFITPRRNLENNGNSAYDTRRTGIIMDGTSNVIKNSSVAYSSGNGVALIGNNSTVSNCVIHDVNYTVTECSGIHFGHWYTTEGTRTNQTNTVIGCKLYNASRSLINHDNANRSRIIGNEFYNCQVGGEAYDLGAVYSITTTGAEIAGNYIHDVEVAGIYLDAGSWNFFIHNNVVIPEDQHSWYRSFIMNAPSGNNVVVNNDFGRSDLGYDIDGVETNHLVANNFFTWVNKSADYTNEMVYANNVVLSSLTESQSNSYFVRATVDYHLKVGSPAIDAGTNVGVTLDYDGKTVPYGAGPDIGAYEWYPTKVFNAIRSFIGTIK